MKSGVNETPRSFHFSGDRPTRLDRFLGMCLPAFSRSRLQSWIRQGHVTVDGVVCRKSGYQLDRSVRVEVQIPAPQAPDLIPEAIELDVIFENDDLLVVNKPAGMVVHPGPGHPSGTLVHAALAHAPKMEGVGGVRRPGVVHRLDKNTSGLILLAKNDRAHQWLQNQFRERAVEKQYLALVDGSPPTPRGRVEAAIGRDSGHRTRMSVVPPGKGRAAISMYRTLERFDHHSYLAVNPTTGRTHQIRVHLAFLGCPIVGDTVYGRRRPTLPIDRHFLHASELKITIPGEQIGRTFKAPLPTELNDVLKSLQGVLPLKT